MTVCVCIASRGRPEELDRTIGETMHLAVRQETGVGVALDDDDPSEYSRFSVTMRGPRERSLGAKYNRAASYAHADTSLFVLGIDDCFPAYRAWDQSLLDAASKFQDGIGVVYFGKKTDDPFQLPEGMALTKGWIDRVGFFMPPYFPYWWHDTWVDELARMTGRYVWADVEWNKHGKTEALGQHKTTRMREVSWWANFFDATRQMRVDKALEVIRTLDYPDWLRAQLRQDMQAKANMFWHRNRGLRDRGKLFEQSYGAENGSDPGYDQIRAEAQAMLDEMSRQAA